MLLPDSDGRPQFFDCGPADELRRLASGGLTTAALRALAVNGRPIAMPERFAPPVLRPSKILCLGKNFAAHAAEMGGAVPTEPMFFGKLADTLIGDGHPVILPHWVETRIDHEIELGVVLGFDDRDGRGAKYVPESRALDLVAGYTVLNDVTARKLQHLDREQKYPWLRSKSFDTFCPVGPWVVPADGFAQVHDVEIRIEVDSELRQQSRTSLLVVGIAAAIAWLSRHTTLRPGDLIAMGTPEGVGPIADGQWMRGTIEGLGDLINPVLREARPPDAVPSLP